MTNEESFDLVPPGTQDSAKESAECKKIQLTKVTRRGRATTGHHPSKPSTDLDRFVLASPAPTNPKTSQLPAASVLSSVLTMSPKVARPSHGS